jgi:ferrous iron transport protein A
MTLRECRPGAEVLLLEMTVDGPDRQRLLDWGFLPGARLSLVARSLAGALVVALDDARVAMDAELAGALIVAEAP